MATYFFETITAAGALMSLEERKPQQDHVVLSSSRPRPAPSPFVPRKQPDWSRPSKQDQRNESRRDSQRMKAKSWQRF
ncbi:MAG TPA: hypothetical protein VGN56_01910 [Candidatus Paceibacterota bacterium]|nr:hypothetical protein [Candidatus Paceibacterota bacterium]